MNRTGMDAEAMFGYGEARAQIDLDAMFCVPETPSLFAEYIGREVARISGGNSIKSKAMLAAIARVAYRECEE